jgi:hypothetical protein
MQGVIIVLQTPNQYCTYYQGDQIKEDEIDRKFGKYGEDAKSIQSFGTAARSKQ